MSTELADSFGGHMLVVHIILELSRTNITVESDRDTEVKKKFKHLTDYFNLLSL